MNMRILRILTVVAGLMASTAAWAADCTAPAGIEGKMIYNTDHHVMQFCNGTNWVSMASTFAGGAWANNGADDLYFNTGNVGIGTDSPDFGLTVNTGNTNTALKLVSTDEASNLVFVDDTSAGRIEMGKGDIFFQVGYDAALSGGFEAMRITSDGDVGIGTTSPASDFELDTGSTNSASGMVLTQTSSAGASARLFFVNDVPAETVAVLNASGDWSFNTGAAPNSTSGTNRLKIQANGNVCGTDSAFESCSSDRRLKKNIHTYSGGGLQKLLALRPVAFQWNDIGVREYAYGADEHLTGFVAQELQEIFPEWVSADEKGYLRIDDGQLRFVMLNAIKELAGQDKALDKRQSDYEGHNTALEKRLEALEAENKALRADVAALKAKLQ